jgi:hypothetical protein
MDNTSPKCPKCGGEMRPYCGWNMFNTDRGRSDFYDADKCRDCDYIVPVITEIGGVKYGPTIPESGK